MMGMTGGWGKKDFWYVRVYTIIRNRLRQQKLKRIVVIKRNFEWNVGFWEDGEEFDSDFYINIDTRTKN